MKKVEKVSGVAPGKEPPSVPIPDAKGPPVFVSTPLSADAPVRAAGTRSKKVA
jgi:hypothetical protein